MGQIDPLDFLQVDRQLTDGERAIRDRVRAFVDEHVIPNIEGWFERGEFPVELSKGFGDLGVLGMNLDGYGCAGSSAVEYGVANREVEYGDSGLRSFVSVQGSLAMFPIHRYGSEEQKQEWLPRMATGEAIGCFALTEPEAGSDPSSMTTTARRDGSDWVLNGHKKWNTNGWASHVAVVWAKDEAGVVRGFVVPSDTSGVEFRELEHAWSLRAAARSELFLHDVRLAGRCRPAGRGGHEGTALLPHRSQVRHRLGHRRRGTRVLRGGPGSCEGAGAVRQAHRLVPARAGQAVRDGVGAERGLTAGAAPWTHEGRRHGDARADQHGQAQQLACCLATAREARALLGATGITFDAPVIRHMNNLESVVTYEGTEEIHTLIVGAALTGLRAFD